MGPNRERPLETSEVYGEWEQHDLVSGIFKGKPFVGEVKSFTRYLDTGEVVANIATNPGDIHIDPSLLKLNMRPGKIENPRFEAGSLE
jgi:hypothetical protein